MALRRGTLARRLEHGVLDIDTCHMARAVFFDEQEIDAADSAADIEDVLAGEIEAFDHLGDFVGSAWRQPAFSPDDFQH
jgi:hypothetical protein